jgi:phage tail sheath protein FI
MITGSTTPGVNVDVNDAPVSRAAQSQPASKAMIVINSLWGPANVVTTTSSFSDSARQFGPLDPNSRGLDFLYAYFNVFAGYLAQVVRVVGPAATLAHLTIKDRGVGAAQKDTVKVESKYFPGAGLDVLVTVEDDGAGFVKITERSVALNVKKVHRQVSMAAADIARVNQEAALIKLTDLASTNPAPTNLPSLTAETALAGGTDDFASLTDASYIGTDNGVTKTGLQCFNTEDYGTGTVALPGVTTEAARVALYAHAEAYRRLAAPDLATGLTKDDVVAVRVAHSSMFACLHWPNVRMLDFAGSGLEKIYPTSGFVAGAIAESEARIGVWQAPAGQFGRVRGAIGVELSAAGQPQVDDSTRGYLGDNQVNPIAPLNGDIKLYDDLVITDDSRVQMIHEIRVLNYLYYAIKASLQNLPFRTIDGSGRLFGEARRVVEQVCRELWNKGRGGLYGKTEAEAFRVVCDSSNNPPESLDRQELNVDVDVRISPTARRVNVSLNNRPITVDLKTLQ